MKVKSPLTKTEVKQSQYAFRDELSLFEKAAEFNLQMQQNSD